MQLKSLLFAIINSYPLIYGPECAFSTSSMSILGFSSVQLRWHENPISRDFATSLKKNFARSSNKQTFFPLLFGRLTTKTCCIALMLMQLNCFKLPALQTRFKLFLLQTTFEKRWNIIKRYFSSSILLQKGSAMMSL